MNLPLVRRHRRDALADISVAVHITGWDASTVMDRVWSGELLWTWNVATDTASTRSEWRFWIGELRAPQAQRDKALPRVLDCVIGKTEMEELSAFSVHEILGITRQHVQRLMAMGELTGRVSQHVRWIKRASLVEFLTRRWTGNLIGSNREVSDRRPVAATKQQPERAGGSSLD